MPEPAHESTFQRGAVLTLSRPIPGADPGCYVLMHNPNATTVALARAGEDRNGDLCPTAHVVTVATADLTAFSSVFGLILEI